MGDIDLPLGLAAMSVPIVLQEVIFVALLSVGAEAGVFQEVVPLLVEELQILQLHLLGPKLVLI